jgi:subtilase-type serine protease
MMLRKNHDREPSEIFVTAMSSLDGCFLEGNEKQIPLGAGMRVTKFTSAFAIVVVASSFQSAYAQTQTIATPLNANAINLLSPFSTLLGTTAITQNFSTSVAINNNSTAAQRAQSLIDNNITTDNGVILSDGLGTNLNTIWRANNSQAANGATTTFSPNLQALFRQINATSQDDSGKAKNYFADGSANGSQFISNGNLALGKAANSNTPIVGIPLPAGGTFNVYDKAYAPVAKPNLTGNSRPVQVSPNSIVAFNGVNAFGVATSNTALIGGVNGNVGSGLFANASFPSGHTTFGYTTSLLFAMLVPERYEQMLARASEYGDSRIVLGAHYALDVIAGRVIGTYDVVQMLNNNPKYLGATVNGVFGIGDLTTTSDFQTVFKAAQTDVRTLLTTGCGTDIATCSATSTPDRFSNLAQDKADYIARLTYGLPTLTFAQAPREAAPAGGPDASILLATVYGGDSAAAKNLAPAGGMFGSLQTSTINQIIMNTETNAIAAFYGTPLSYWSRLDLFSAESYFQGVTGTITLASSDVVTTKVTVANGGTLAGTGAVAATTVASGGILQPGSGAGTSLKINGSLAFASGALYLVQVNSQTASFANVTGTGGSCGDCSDRFADQQLQVQSSLYDPDLRRAERFKVRYVGIADRRDRIAELFRQRGAVQPDFKSRPDCGPQRQPARRRHRAGQWLQCTGRHDRRAGRDLFRQRRAKPDAGRR